MPIARILIAACRYIFYSYHKWLGSGPGARNAGQPMEALAINSNLQDSGVSVPRGSDDLICNTKECGGHPHLSVLLNGDEEASERANGKM